MLKWFYEFMQKAWGKASYVRGCVGQFSSDRVRGGAMGSRLRLWSWQATLLGQRRAGHLQETGVCLFFQEQIMFYKILHLMKKHCGSFPWKLKKRGCNGQHHYQNQQWNPIGASWIQRALTATFCQPLLLHSRCPSTATTTHHYNNSSAGCSTYQMVHKTVRQSKHTQVYKHCRINQPVHKLSRAWQFRWCYAMYQILQCLTWFQY